MSLTMATAMLILFGFCGCKNANKQAPEELEQETEDTTIVVQETQTVEVDTIRVISLDELSSPEGLVKGHGYIDLGLSVKWATCNVGASSPEEYGNYYAWGETQPKSSYTKKNSKTYGKEIVGSVSGKPQYDAARANWGGTWRLPSFDEIHELNTLSWEWVTLGNHMGYKLTASNGNSIFLPAAGGRYEEELEGADKFGFYWTGEPNEDDEEEYYSTSYDLIFPDAHMEWGHWAYRYYGFTIRPVTE